MNNNLNSVLIEGTVDSTAKVDDNLFLLNLIVNSKHQVPITVIATGALGENAYEYVTPGRELRIVGRLIMHDGAISIEGEHIEFRGMVRDRVA